MAKVVLFYPRLWTLSEDKAMGYVKEGEHAVPLSLLAIARPLLRAGHQVVIIDQRMEGDRIEQTLAEVRDAVCLGVSCLSGYHLQGGIEVSKLVKERYPDLPVVWGGWHVTTLPDQTIEAPYIDIIVRGQGENTLSELVEHLERGTDWSGVQGLTWRQDGKAEHSPARGYDPLANMGMFPYHLLDMNWYIEHPVVPPELQEDEISRPVMVISSYGCAFNCGFCGHKVQYRRWYPLPAERVVKELELLVNEYGMTYFLFADGDPAINEKRMLAILDGMEERGLKLEWEFTARVDDIMRYRDETLLRMQRMGMVYIHVGLESGVDRLLVLMNKQTTREMNEAAAAKLAGLGIPMMSSFIFGLPTETREELIENVRFMIKVRSLLPENSVSYMFYMPTPATPLFDLAIEHGYVPPADLEEWSRFTFRLKSINVPWLSEDLRRFMEALVRVYLVLAYPPEERLKKWESRKIAPIYRLAMRWARFRIEHGFYALPVEPFLVKWLHSKPLALYQKTRKGLNT